MIGKLGLAVASLGCDEPERRCDHIAFYRMLVYRVETHPVDSVRLADCLFRAW